MTELIDEPTRRAAGWIQPIAQAGLVTAAGWKCGELAGWYSVSDTTYLLVGAPFLVLLLIAFAPTARQRWRAKDPESGIFFLQVLLLGGLVLGGGGWLVSSLGGPSDLALLGVVGWVVLLPPVWLVGVMALRLWRRVRTTGSAPERTSSNSGRRKLIVVLGLIATAGAWWIAHKLGVGSHFAWFAGLVLLPVAAFHFAAVIATSAHLNIYNDEAYTPDALMSSITGEGIATLSEVRAELRRRLARTSTRTRRVTLGLTVVVLSGALIDPAVPLLAVVIAALLVGGISGRAAQARFGTSRADQ